jgi:uncharacterized protein
MPDGASKLRDVNQLSDQGAAFDYELAVAQLPGFPLHLNAGAGAGAGAGSVRARVRFGREHGWPSARVELDAEVELLCQRCMRAMRIRLGTDSTVLFADSEQAGESAPEGSETFLAPEGRISLAALIGEELLLALPIVPRHESGAHCEAAEPPASIEVAAASPPVTRPFADLRALLDRGAKQKD